MGIYVKLGMKPMHALQTATINAAKALKINKDLGTLEAGKLPTSSPSTAIQLPTSRSCKRRRTSRW